jgi:surface antigen
MRKILIVAVISMIASGAYAFGTSVFLDAPVTRLSAEELQTFKTFVEKTLDESPDGKTVEWKAPKARFTSKLTPGKPFTEAGLKCREITIESDSHDRYQRGRYLFCKVKTGSWEFRLPKSGAASGQR